MFVRRGSLDERVGLVSPVKDGIGVRPIVLSTCLNNFLQ
jgi:hypothetical protein